FCLDLSTQEGRTPARLVLGSWTGHRAGSDRDPSRSRLRLAHPSWRGDRVHRRRESRHEDHGSLAASGTRQPERTTRTAFRLRCFAAGTGRTMCSARTVLASLRWMPRTIRRSRPTWRPFAAPDEEPSPNQAAVAKGGTRDRRDDDETDRSDATIARLLAGDVR